MRTGANPFTDPAEVQGPLYATAGRLASRTSALHRARVSGRHAADVIADLAADAAVPAPAVIADIGCGRGTTTLHAGGQVPAARIVAIDLSAALLTTARNRYRPPRASSGGPRGLPPAPLADGACDLIVAAFCLYHSPDPRQRHHGDHPLPAPGRRDGDHRGQVSRQLPGTRPAGRRLWPRPRSGRQAQPVPGRPQRQHRATRRREP